MKNKGLIITILALVIVAITAAVSYDFVAQKNYSIPSNYILQLEDNNLQQDGSITTYYLYYDHIITETTYSQKNINKGKIRFEIYKNIKTDGLKTVKEIKDALNDKKPNRTIVKEA